MSVTMEVEDGTALITMDDGKANAISHEMLDALEPALSDAEADDTVKAIVLAGREGKFCAGFDLKTMQGAAPADAAKLVNRGGVFAHQLFACAKPVVGAATGHGIAMGALLLLACDTRVGPNGAFKFGLNETAIGMVMPRFGLELGKARLQSAALTSAIVQARIYDSEGAVAAGYLDLLTNEDTIIGTALEIAAALGNLPAKAYAGNKKLVRKPFLKAMEKSLS
ncbi:crotonase/enoyl-CoA hydratase family protein [Pacificimonas sp. WHA3]|uniref:Crotonase/enoyl-CoA hydratase family protein n=1 Tax=Pacificimonas pallii TaxID=2827236 RepID=A0ABS6SG52_9SPHN|nr:crotonase/enoyl-CoA hydratase family protein [Pacificimonas pallii]MBV7257397.1 crotonase/enoyl-CoA hydratase family protein [Pacificimonas pallii]